MRFHSDMLVQQDPMEYIYVLGTYVGYVGGATAGKSLLQCKTTLTTYIQYTYILHAYGCMRKSEPIIQVSLVRLKSTYLVPMYTYLQEDLDPLENLSILLLEFRKTKILSMPFTDHLIFKAKVLCSCIS